MAGFNDQEAGKKKAKRDDVLTSYMFKGNMAGDVAVAIPLVLREMGLSFKETTTTMETPMGDMEVPFQHAVVLDGKKKIDIPYGSYDISDVGKLRPQNGKRGEIVPEITLTMSFADKTGTRGRAEWETMIKLIEARVNDRTNSLFHGRAVKILGPRDFLIPQYIDVETDITLYMNDDVAEMVDDHIFYHIRAFDQIKAAGVRTQRGVLLHGKYGTGKSLIAYKAARVAHECHRTFVLCEMSVLRESIEVARFMQPSVLFVEDMDNMRGNDLSTLRNLMSGVESKHGHDVIAILTTNFLEEVIKTDRSFMRPERIDAVIEVTVPSIRLIERIIREAGGAYIQQDADWGKAATIMGKSGRVTPAIILEMVNRIKVKSMKLQRPLSFDEVGAVYDSLKLQVELSSPALPDPETLPIRFCRDFQTLAMGAD